MFFFNTFVYFFSGTGYTLMCSCPPPVTWNVESQNRDPPPSIVLSDTSQTATDEEEGADDDGELTLTWPVATCCRVSLYWRRCAMEGAFT